MILVAIDTGRGMREAMPAVRAAVRRARGAVAVAALGDYRCHLMQTGERFHACGLDRSFELAMLYFARRGPGGLARRSPRESPGAAATAKAATLIFCGNGGYRDAISANHARLLGLPCDDHVYTADAFRELRRRWSVRMLYVARGVYDTGVGAWETLVGKRNVTALDGPRGLGPTLERMIRG